MAEHLTIPGALEWDTIERHSIATLRYAGGKEHDVKYVSEVAYDALKRKCESAEGGWREATRVINMQRARLDKLEGLLWEAATTCRVNDLIISANYFESAIKP